MAIDEHWLNEAVRAHRVHPVRFAGHTFLLDGRGVLYCPVRDALVVSDLHLEKGSFLGQFANPIPQFDSLSTLRRLNTILDDYSPRTVVCLGDSFHDKGAFERLGTQERQLLQTLIGQCEQWYWILGNHDPEIPRAFGGVGVESVRWQGVVFRHEPERDPTLSQIVGHYHPKCRAVIARRRFGGRCFVHNDRLMIMPAFGQYTGGLDINHEALLSWLAPREREVFLTFDKKVYAVSRASV